MFKFPSPCGEKVGINIIKIYSTVQHNEVSVPLRGKGRDQLKPLVLVKSQFPSFRPLAGKR